VAGCRLLEELRYRGHVARFIKQNPFRMGEGWNSVCIDSLEFLHIYNGGSLKNSLRRTCPDLHHEKH